MQAHLLLAPEPRVLLRPPGRCTGTRLCIRALPSAGVKGRSSVGYRGFQIPGRDPRPQYPGDIPRSASEQRAHQTTQEISRSEIESEVWTEAGYDPEEPGGDASQRCFRVQFHLSYEWNPGGEVFCNILEFETKFAVPSWQVLDIDPMINHSHCQHLPMGILKNP